MESLTISEGEEAKLVATRSLKERGVSLETGLVVFNKKCDFDVYGTTGELTAIGEAKVKVGLQAVERLIERIEEAKRWPEKLLGKVVTAPHCIRAAHGAAEEAERLGVRLIEPMREKTKLQP